MTRTAAETITYNHRNACEQVVSLRNRIAEEAAAAQGGIDIASTVNLLISAEATRDFWSRLEQASLHQSKQGQEFTEALAMKLTMTLLAQGADDTWSGRGNEAKRVRFDAFRMAAQKVEWIF